MSLDGTNFFYVNPLPHHRPLCPSHSAGNISACLMSFLLPANLVRTIASSTQFVRQSRDTIWVNLCGASELKPASPAAQSETRTETEYPWSGRIRIKILKRQKEFTLKLRIPGWTKTAATRVNHGPADTSMKPAAITNSRRAEIWRRRLISICRWTPS